MEPQCSQLWPSQPTRCAVVVTEHSDKEGGSRRLRLQLDHATDPEGDGLIHDYRGPPFSQFVLIAGATLVRHSTGGEPLMAITAGRRDGPGAVTLDGEA